MNADQALDLEDLASSLNLRSCMSVPVFVFGDLAGILSVYLPQPRGFADREVHLVGAMAQEVGVEVVRRGELSSPASTRSAVPVT